MPFKSCNIGRLFRAVAALFLATPVAAQLDWSTDVVVFGTESNERYPLIVPIGGGQFRSICIWEDQTLRTRRSLLRGEAWRDFDDVDLEQGARGIAATSDGQFTYVWQPAGMIRRIANTSDTWPPDVPLQVSPELSNVSSGELFTDREFDPVDTYVHGIVAHRSNGTAYLSYFRSEDHALTVAAYEHVDSALLMRDSIAAVDGAFTWSGDDERLWAAVTLDRPGSIEEQIVLYYSDDLGNTWSQRITPDSSSYGQLNPSLIGRNETLVMAYQRRSSISMARDVFLTYSPDNGVTWSEPMQLTDHAFDDTEPKLEISGDEIGLVYSRRQLLQPEGQLLFRSAPLSRPWEWSPEVEVCEASTYSVSEGFSLAGDENGFAVVWTGRIVGEDDDVFFDATWRGTSAEEPIGWNRGEAAFTQDAASGRIGFTLPHGKSVDATLFDVLGRSVQTVHLAGPHGTWIIPQGVASGAYWFSVPGILALRINIVR